MRASLALLAFLLTVLPASSATIRVPADQYTLQAGIDAASEGDTVLVAPGTYGGEGNFELDFGGVDLALISEAGAAETVIDCNSAGRGFYFHSGESNAALVRGFTIRQGDAHSPEIGKGGGICCVDASPTMMDLVVKDCLASLWFEACGAGIYLRNSDAVLVNVELFRNECNGVGELGYAGGGGLYCEDSSPLLENCRFVDNILRWVAFWDWDCCLSIDGGGMSSWGGHPVLENVVFAGNTVEYDHPEGESHGGGLAANGPITITGATFYNNGAEYGSALSCSETSALSRVIIAHHDTGFATVEGAPQFNCSDIFGNAPGDWVGDIAGQMPGDGNISEDPMFCDLVDLDLHLDEDSPCLPEHNGCGLMGALGAGCEGTAVDDVPVAAGLRLLPAHPNPFNPRTSLSFHLAESGPVRLSIHDLTGRRLRMLADGILSAGDHQRIWDGRDDAGRELPSGVYLCRLEASAGTDARKLTLLR